MTEPIKVESIDDGRSRLRGLDFCESMSEILSVLKAMLQFQTDKKGFVVVVGGDGKVTDAATCGTKEAIQMPSGPSTGGFCLNISEKTLFEKDGGIGYCQWAAAHFKSGRFDYSRLRD
jgi:hypothetical protein